MVSLCPCEVLFQLHLDAVVLYALLLGHFFHHSHWNIAIVVARAAAAAVIIDPVLCCSSGSAIYSNVFVVSS